MNFGEFVWKGRLSNKNTNSQKYAIRVFAASLTFVSIIRIFAKWLRSLTCSDFTIKKQCRVKPFSKTGLIPSR